MPTWFDLEILFRAAVGTRHPGPAGTAGGVDVYLTVVDHFEPQVGRPERAVARQRVQEWVHRYPEIVSKHQDSEGTHPRHSFFYPWDEYDSWELEQLSSFCRGGWGEVELHLHHQDDTDSTLRGKLREAVRVYREHGVLTSWPDGRPAFAFIHGNWALDNSRCEGGKNYCGVNNELDVLMEEGCYADFTFPAWRHTAQPRTVNRIYYAVDRPDRPKSYDYGHVARVGATDQAGLLLIQGPLAPYVERKRGRLALGVDDADLAGYRRYAPARLDRWVRTAVQVAGRPDRIFIKLHTHGAADRNREVLLGSDLDALFTDAEARYNDGARYRLHYVTARQMYNVVKATEAGVELPPAQLRDYALPAPSASTSHSA